MTDFSRFENTKKVRKPRKPIRWGKIGIVVGTVVFAVVAVTGTALLVEHLLEVALVDNLVNIDSRPSEPKPKPSEPESTGLTFEKLRAHYDARENLTTIQFMEKDEKLKGETVVYFATVTEVTFDYSTFNVRYDHGFVWDEFWKSTEREINFADTPENRAKLLLWDKGTRLKFECVYKNAMNTLAMQPRWKSKSCIVMEE